MNSKYDYKIGQVYGIRKLEKLINQNGKTMAVTTCILCGKQSVVRPYSLFQSKSNSCICRNKTVNGDSSSKLYGIFSNMKYRCNTKTANEYKNYGGRGIKICDEWMSKDGFNRFKKWAILNGYKDGLTIDRIDGNGMYEPQNCRWITLSENVAHANRSNRKQHRKANKGMYYAISNDGYIEFENANSFAKTHSINASMVRKAAHKSGEYAGWKFGFVCDLNNREPQSTIENPEPWSK